ncbi:recombinase RecT [Limnobaculum xujianqingii]|uniref:recombinase RecT n=1 Tax=Limnobaculum xujianqingii TaxID=2738837 RepID=UPI001129286F|nr:recombinase RecT [Limnobaculum xujianqingii]
MANTKLDTVKNVVLSLSGEFQKTLSDQSLNFARESGFALQALQNNPYLLGIATGNQASLTNAIVNIAAIGISLNPASKLAYLVPRDNKVCIDISYMGLMHIAQQTGAIKWCQADVVRRTDRFKRMGITLEPLHEYECFAEIEQRGDMVGVYSVIKTDDGDFLTHTMRIADVFNIRDRSVAWKAYIKDKSKTCPWATDEEQMVLKTCVKQAAKYWPRRDRLDNAIEYLNTELDEGINFAAERSGTEPKDITPASDESLNHLFGLMAQTGKTEASIVEGVIPRLIGRSVTSIPDLTEEEARKLIGFIEKRIKTQGAA